MEIVIIGLNEVKIERFSTLYQQLTYMCYISDFFFLLFLLPFFAHTSREPLGYLNTELVYLNDANRNLSIQQPQVLLRTNEQ